MRVLATATLCAALVLGVLAACSDDDPIGLPGTEAPIAIVPEFAQLGAQGELPINTVRLTARDASTDRILAGPDTTTVTPNATAWDVSLRLPASLGRVSIVVVVELLNVTGGVETVEWSGMVGPIAIEPGRRPASTTVQVFPGPPGNLSITAVTATGPDTVSVGDTATFRAVAAGASGSPSFFWNSLDAPAAVIAAAGDSARVEALAPGTARVVVAAGPRVDTLSLVVLPQVDSIAVAPAADTAFALGAQVTFTATAFDAGGAPVPGVTGFAWSSSDTTVARSLGGGVFQALGVGDVVVTAAAPRDPTVTATAALRVVQLPASVALTPDSTSVVVGDSAQLAAVVADANGFAIPGATVAWTSRAPAVVSVGATGRVKALAPGATWIVGTAGTAADSTRVVATQTVASVVVTPDSLAFTAFGDSAALALAATDALGNPIPSPATTWLSRNSAVATVSAAGMVTATGNGGTWVVGTSGGVSDSARVSVAQAVSSIAVTLAPDTLDVGGAAAAAAVARDANGNVVAGAPVAWSSTDPAVATVDAAGTVGAVGYGSAWIRGASGAAADSALLSVLPTAPFGTTAYWLGTASVDWADPANWSDGAPPTAADVVWVPAAAAFQPTLAAPDTVGSIAVENGATLTLNDTLAVAGNAFAGTTIVGPGPLHMIGTGALRGTVPALVVDGTVTVDSTTVVAGDVDVANAGSLAVADSFTIAGSVRVTGASSPKLQLSSFGAVSIADSLLTAGTGTLVMQVNGVVAVGGNARFEGGATNGVLLNGTLRVGGDFHATGAAWHALGTVLELDGGVDQTVELVNPGPGASQAALRDLLATKSGGAVIVTTDGWVGRDLIVGPGTAFRSLSRADQWIAIGDVSVGDSLVLGRLQLGGALAVTGGMDVPTVVFAGSGQSIPTGATVDYDTVLVAGTATWAGPDTIAGDLRVASASSLTLAGALGVGGDVGLDGALALVGRLAVTGGFATVGAGAVSLDAAADTLDVTGDISLAGAAGTMTGGAIVANREFLSTGASFRSTGTTLLMRGSRLQMSNAGPAAGQGILARLEIDSDSLLVDSVYVTGDVADLDSSYVIDVGQIENGGSPWFGLLRVEGSLGTDRTGYTFSHIMVGDSLLFAVPISDVDSVEFTGNGQVAPAVDPNTLAPITYNTIIVSGDSVDIGTAVEATALNNRVIVRGAGATAVLRSSGTGTIGSLVVEQGDASTGVVLGADFTVLDSVAVATGSVDPGGFTLRANTSASAVTAFRTTGTGVLRMSDPLDSLVSAFGNLDFGGGSTAGLLTAGTVELGAGGNFISVGAAFRSTGTTVLLRGQSVSMSDAGPGATQGALADLLVASSDLSVLDSLYVTGRLDDVAAFPGSSISDPSGSGYVRVLGPVLLDSTAITLNHLALADSLAVGGTTSFNVDTTEFIGTGQRAHSEGIGFVTIPYKTILVTGDSVELAGPTEYLGQPTANLVVRGAGTTLSIYSSDDGQLGSLIMEGGDATQRVRLFFRVAVFDSVHVASGVLDLNGFQFTADYNGVVPVALRTTGTGILELNQLFDELYVPNGDVYFEGGQSVLDSGLVRVEGTTSTFHATGAAYQAGGTYTQVDVDTIVVVNGGPGAAQARFDALGFASQDLNLTTLLSGDVFVADSLVETFFSTELIGGPGTSLTVLGKFRTPGTTFQLPLLVASDTILGDYGTYDVDVTQLAGAAQTLPSFPRLPFDTLLVTGNVTMEVDTFAFPDTIAGVVHVAGGSLTLAPSGFVAITDSVLVDGPGAIFDPGNVSVEIGNATTRNGNLATVNGGVFAMLKNVSVTVNGPVDFNGGSTAGLLTAGTLVVRGDFTATGGAFQASGSHFTSFKPATFNLPGMTIKMPDGGAGAGQDHFRDVGLYWWSNNPMTLASDVFATGAVYTDSDSFATLDGAGFRLVSDGWSFGGGITFRNVTVELDDALDPATPATVNVFGPVFGAYANDVTRMRISHPGSTNPLNLSNVDLSGSTGGSGLYLDVVDSDGPSPDALGVAVTFVNQPFDWDARRQASNGATITP